MPLPRQVAVAGLGARRADLCRYAIVARRIKGWQTRHFRSGRDALIAVRERSTSASS